VFYDGTSEKVRIDNNGNVGIGTASPKAKLEVNGTSKLGNSGGGYSWFPYTDNNAYVSGENIILRTNAGTTEQVRITDTGNVGIGTTSPDRKLHIYKGASGETPSAEALLVLEDDTTVGLQFLSSTGVSKIMFERNSDFDRGAIFYSSIGMELVSGASTRVIIKEDGNVGIGTTTVNSRFVVEGGGGNILDLYDSVGAAKVTVLNDGNVGIGTTGLGYKLDVNGTVRIGDTYTLCGKLNIAGAGIKY
jgi:hypothetical protein